MGQLYEKLVQEDLNLGTGVVWLGNPAGGKLKSTQVGLHTFARNQKQSEAAWTPGVITAGSKASTTLTVPNAEVADFVTASHDKILTSDLRISGHVSAANTVKVVVHNPTASSVTVPAGTVKVLAFGVVSGTPVEPPTCNITAPTGPTFPGSSGTITVTATDAVYGIKNVRIWFQYCGGSFVTCGDSVLLATLTSSPYQYVWTFPGCAEYPLDYFRIVAQSESNSDNLSPYAAVDVRLIGRGC